MKTVFAAVALFASMATAFRPHMPLLGARHTSVRAPMRPDPSLRSRVVMMPIGVPKVAFLMLRSEHNLSSGVESFTCHWTAKPFGLVYGGAWKFPHTAL